MHLEDFPTQWGFKVKQHETYIVSESIFGRFELIAYSEKVTLILVTLNNDLTYDVERILDIEKLSNSTVQKVKKVLSFHFQHHKNLCKTS